jgi:hypothetical protein
VRDDYEKRRNDLWFAMRTRPLTDEELAEAEGWGRMLNIQMRVSYNEGQKASELADAWALQGVLRATACQPNAGYVGGANNSLFEIRELGT